MKLDAQAQAALRESDSQAITVPLTDELKEKCFRVSCLVIDLLQANTTSPIEAYMMLKFVQSSLETSYGIRGGIIMHSDDPIT